MQKSATRWDKGLGNKRLASMPDRVTNTINTLDHGTVNRPTVISCALSDMTQMNSWWAAWKAFMFEKPVTVTGKGGKVSTSKPCALLPKIKRDKYPAVTEEEEAISIPLQALCIGIFDAILVHMLNTLSPTGGWQVRTAGRPAEEGSRQQRGAFARHPPS